MANKKPNYDELRHDLDSKMLQAVLKCSRSRVYKLISSGRLPSEKVARMHVLRRSEVQRTALPLKPDGEDVG